MEYTKVSPLTYYVRERFNTEMRSISKASDNREITKTQLRRAIYVHTDQH